MLDTSAVIAYLKSEPGADVVETHLLEAAISAVNVAEVVTVTVREGGTRESARVEIEHLNLDMIDFDGELAIETGALVAETKKYGLSLGDRACLATAAREGIPVLTAERSWSNLSLGIAIQLIR
jgi:PIN domain nuclease of toxin-antitoxin system